MKVRDFPQEIRYRYRITELPHLWIGYFDREAGDFLPKVHTSTSYLLYYACACHKANFPKCSVTK